MILSEIFRRFSEKAPMPVMVRALLERTFHPARLDAWFEQTAEAQYTRELLFSTLFELMSQVVCRVRRSVHDAYQAAEHIATSVGAVTANWPESSLPRRRNWCAIPRARRRS